ncbi:substrate-binding periplasmic protein [Pseudodesulfovibrio sp.]|uniref:substrate-binding periplasmic protein n=1 Tax=unclassified Pseudodesulfovibrio TaxID=2661612 RepID=UPI003B0063DE
MRTLSGSLLLLLFTTFCVSPASAYDPWAVKPVCVFGMPYIGRAVLPHQGGIITEILRRVLEPEGVVLQHESMPYGRTVDELVHGSVQCSLSIGNDPRTVLRGKHPIFLYDLCVARAPETAWKGVKSLQGQRVAYVHGFDLPAILGVEFSPQKMFDLASAFSLLRDGTVAYILDGKNLLETARKESGVYLHQVVIEPIRTLPVHLVFAPTKEGRLFRDLYDRRMTELKQAGELKAILTESGLSETRAVRLLKAQ